MVECAVSRCMLFCFLEPGITIVRPLIGELIVACRALVSESPAVLMGVTPEIFVSGRVVVLGICPEIIYGDVV